MKADMKTTKTDERELELDSNFDDDIGQFPLDASESDSREETTHLTTSISSNSSNISAQPAKSSLASSTGLANNNNINNKPETAKSNLSTTISANIPTNLKTVPPAPRPIDKEAQAIKDRVQLPAPPCEKGGKVDYDVMQEWLDTLTPEMCKQVLTYVYRLKPVIDRGLTQPNISPRDITKNIDKLMPPFTKDDIINVHGGGEYKLHVNNLRGTMFYSKLVVSQVEHEPQLDPRELVIDNPDNYHYVRKLKLKGVLNDKGEVVNTLQSQPMIATGNSDATVKEFSSIVNKLLETIAKRPTDDNKEVEGIKAMSQVMLEKMKQDNPNNILPVIVEMMKSITEAKSQSHSQSNSNDPTQFKMLELLMGLITASMTQAANLQTQVITLLTSKKDESTSSTDPFKVVDKMLDLQTKISDRFNQINPNNGERDWTDKVVDGIERIGPMFAPLFSGLGAKLAGIPPGQVVPMHPTSPMHSTSGMPNPLNQANPSNFDPSNPTNPNPPQLAPQMPNLPIQSPSNLTQAPNSTNGIPNEQLQQELWITLNQTKGLLCQKLDNGIPGCEVARALEIMFGVGEVKKVISCGVETIVHMMMQIPEYSRFGPQFLTQWVSSFCNYEEELSGEMNGDGDGDMVRSGVSN